VRAEHVADQGDLGFRVKRPQGDPGGPVAFEPVEEKLGGPRVRRPVLDEEPPTARTAGG
jgi:hypothetical protein